MQTASKIHKQTELYKQMLLLGNCGIVLQTREPLSLEGGKRADSGELDETRKNRQKFREKHKETQKGWRGLKRQPRRSCVAGKRAGECRDE